MSHAQSRKASRSPFRPRALMAPRRFPRAAGIACAVGSFFMGASRADAVPLSPEAQVERLATWLENRLDSSLQALEDRAYFDVTVRHCRVQPETLGAKKDGSIYLFVQQAMSLSLDAPYRVRFMRLAPNRFLDQVTSTVFEPKGAEAYVGLCDRPVAERRVPDALFEDAKCTLFLDAVPGGAAAAAAVAFVGQTPRQGCPSQVRGSTYMTSKARVAPGFMESWDQGFSAEGKQVWGAVKGPYTFLGHARQDAELVNIASMFVGRMDNEAQSKAAPADYSSIGYEFCHVRFADGALPNADVVLYAAQTIQTPGGALKRDRFYHFARDTDGSIAFNAHAVAVEGTGALAGLCARPQKDRFALSAAVLKRDESCPMTFKRKSDDSAYVGATPEGGCPSSFRGATKLFIEEEVSHDAVKVWERWYDDAGHQVAGSKAGPYIYKVSKEAR